jgi:hypothetical protein
MIQLTGIQQEVATGSRTDLKRPTKKCRREETAPLAGSMAEF